MNSEYETKLPNGAVVFPDPYSVFGEDRQNLAQHLMPLMTVSLEDINPADPAWRGCLHVVAPAELLCGVIGDETPHAHSPLLKPNWIGFIVEKNLYRLAGDPRFFVLHPENVNLILKENAHKDVVNQRDEAFSQLAEAREYYRLTGTLQGGDEWVEQYGGPVDALGNWVELGNFPMAYEDSTDGEEKQYAFPVSPAGNRFYHVVTLPGYSYVPDQPCILLFYEPVEKLALVTFDWS